MRRSITKMKMFQLNLIKLSQFQLSRKAWSFIGIGLFSFLLACSSPEEQEYKKAEAAADDGHFRVALTHYANVIESTNDKLALKAARRAAKIAHFEVKDFRRSAEFYRKIVLKSADALERLAAQKMLADIYFDHLADYKKAVIEINRFLSLSTDSQERTKYKISLARAYYYQNLFDQALNEVEEFLKIEPNEINKFDMLMLKGNILMAQKELGRAADVFKAVLQKYPDKSKHENVALTLAICYEEMKDFKSAINTLSGLKENHPVPEYIDIRIKRLEERRKNQPGARGFRK